MKTRNVWRLANRPTSEDVVKLLSSGIITKEEAKDILFNVEEEGERDKKSLESEIKFLRELVERLSNGNQTKIIETIRYVEKPYIQYPWYQPYQYWCGTSSLGSVTTSTNNALNDLVGGTYTSAKSTSGNAMYTIQATGSNNLLANTGSGGKFTAIKTF
ncbi:MAG: hypothetical protein NUW00_05565 [Candidatus Kaiserbacteria bacterium]|nr:hypothetical protein [Candidatus Kaiserbacteria bacterium]